VAQLERAGNPDASVDEYFRVIDRKTASLIAWCARVGGSVEEALAGPLERYGRALGRAFQIADDVLDSSIDEATAGKSVGHDLQEGKLTLPVLLACEADPALGRRVRGHLGEHGVPAGVVAQILAEVRAAGGIEHARRKAAALADQAIAELDALPASPYRDGLRALARASADRSS
jgi:octaprenyl-diphosphate synthase